MEKDIEFNDNDFYLFEITQKMDEDLNLKESFPNNNSDNPDELLQFSDTYILMVIGYYQKLYNFTLKEEFVKSLLIQGKLNTSDKEKLDASEIKIINNSINEVELQSVVELKYNYLETEIKINIVKLQFTEKSYIFQILSMIDVGNIKNVKKENKDFINVDFLDNDMFENDEEKAVYKQMRKHNPKRRMLKMLLKYGATNEEAVTGFEWERLKVFDNLYDNTEVVKNCGNLKILLKAGIKVRKGNLYLKNKDVELIL